MTRKLHDGKLHCSGCDIYKFPKEFGHRNEKNKPVRVRSRCTECVNMTARERYHKNPEKNHLRYKAYYKENTTKAKQKALRYYHAVEKLNVPKTLWKHARFRAKKNNLPFDIQISDIVVPDVCPVLGILLIPGSGSLHKNSPTLDRISPSRGYVVDNIAVMSYFANAIKQNATSDELFKVATWTKQHGR